MYYSQLFDKMIGCENAPDLNLLITSQYKQVFTVARNTIKYVIFIQFLPIFCDHI